MRHQEEEERERESWRVLGGESGRVGASPRGQAGRIPGLMSVLESGCVRQKPTHRHRHLGYESVLKCNHLGHFNLGFIHRQFPIFTLFFCLC